MSITELIGAGAQTEQSPKRFATRWLEQIDALLNLHRTHYLVHDPTPAELESHKAALALAIQTGLFLNSLIEDPAVCLRLQLLKDAYTVFHDPSFSEEETERLLKELFPG
jgi:hypothetical protein